MACGQGAQFDCQRHLYGAPPVWKAQPERESRSYFQRGSSHRDGGGLEGCAERIEIQLRVWQAQREKPLPAARTDEVRTLQSDIHRAGELPPQRYTGLLLPVQRQARHTRALWRHRPALPVERSQWSIYRNLDLV